MVQLRLASFLALMLFNLPNSFAKASVTIYDTSIKWEDEINKTKLLEKVPAWDLKKINILFEVYRHPEHYQLPIMQDTNNYNLQFINAFWGPLENPFITIARPIKVFVFIGSSSEPYYIPPLIKSLSDGNYYVFDKNQTKPLLLNDWINYLKSLNNFQVSVRFNVCQAYGSAPSDACSLKTYQDEVNKIYQDNYLFKKNVPSAKRNIHEDWRMKVKFLNQSSFETNTIYHSSIPWGVVKDRNNLLNTVVAWPTYQVIKDNFAKIRDIRYFDDEESKHFLRRITWLYPDDGCWTRASAAIKDLFGPFNNVVAEFPRPSKVFAFGNLCANTPNSPNQSVYWWYHTAPIVKDAQSNQTYVLDPAINPYTPLTVEDWMLVISSETQACAGSHSNVSLFNICNGYGTNPFDDCDAAYKNEIYSMLDQSTYRNAERYRQVELNRDVEKVLGDLPPWLN